jgi:hypothetical protein
MIGRRAGWALLFAAMLAGCGGRKPATCIDICDMRNVCPGATRVDCGPWCGMREALNSTTSCTQAYIELLNCDCDNTGAVCVPSGGPCEAEAAAWKMCVASYCVGTPLPSGC